MTERRGSTFGQFEVAVEGQRTKRQRLSSRLEWFLLIVSFHLGRNLNRRIRKAFKLRKGIYSSSTKLQVVRILGILLTVICFYFGKKKGTRINLDSIIINTKRYKSNLRLRQEFQKYASSPTNQDMAEKMKQQFVQEINS
eukprot:snap_masked-scaffold_31-processed-gene-1.42-mRNA-1 protein AED:1.00 eAED:1.00 QI:0/-1/0/0/-1/1/1/0/139